MALEVITEPKIEIAPDLLNALKNQVDELGQVILHFIYKAPIASFMNIRIWPTCYLYDQHSSHKSEMVHFEHITLAPNWVTLFPGERFYFSLIFSGLPKSCVVFDFIEHCENEKGAFECRGIVRNDTDVYYISIE